MCPTESAAPDAPSSDAGGICTTNTIPGRIAPLRKRGSEQTTRTGWAKMWPECLARPSTIAVPSVRREWLDGSLTLAGAVLGWLTPLALKWAGSGASGNFYEYGEMILCPLFACFGAGLGLMNGVLWGAARRGGANGQR
jgi:hypothetical protein